MFHSQRIDETAFSQYLVAVYPSSRLNCGVTKLLPQNLSGLKVGFVVTNRKRRAIQHLSLPTLDVLMLGQHTFSLYFITRSTCIHKEHVWTLGSIMTGPPIRKMFESHLGLLSSHVQFTLVVDLFLKKCTSTKLLHLEKARSSLQNC